MTNNYNQHYIKMYEHLNTTNVKFNNTSPDILNNKMFHITKNTVGFGKNFMDKNKERISQIDTSINSKKYSQRYLINPNKLEKLYAPFENETKSLNKTLMNTSKTYDELKKTSFMFKQTSQSHRSHLLTVNLKKLPRLQNPSSTKFNISHSKLYVLNDEMNNVLQDVRSLTMRTQEMSIGFESMKKSLQNQTTQIQTQLKIKVKQLQHLVSNIKSQQYDRSERLRNDSEVIKQKTVHLKSYFDRIQFKIQSLENSLGMPVSNDKYII